MKTYDKIAVELLTEMGVKQVWMGMTCIWHEIYDRKNPGHKTHPINQWYAVSSALRRSKLFKVSGHIKAPGFTTCREIAHTVYILRQAT